jgi:nicotinamidase/pyrazinamidase
VSLTALDAKELLPGVKINFIEDASRGIDPDGVEAAKRKMKSAGINIIKTASSLSPARPAAKRPFHP